MAYNRPPLYYWRHRKAQHVYILHGEEYILSLKSSAFVACSCLAPSSVWLCLQKKASATEKTELIWAFFRVTCWTMRVTCLDSWMYLASASDRGNSSDLTVDFHSGDAFVQASLNSQPMQRNSRLMGPILKLWSEMKYALVPSILMALVTISV